MGSWDLWGVYVHVLKFYSLRCTNLNFWPLGFWNFDRWKFEFSNFVQRGNEKFFLCTFRIYTGLYVHLLPGLSYRVLKIDFLGVKNCKNRWFAIKLACACGGGSDGGQMMYVVKTGLNDLKTNNTYSSYSIHTHNSMTIASSQSPSHHLAPT